MKRLTTALLFLMMAVVTAMPQKITGKSVFGAGTGISLPLDEFAVNYFTWDAGFASSGPNLEAEYLYYGKIFGFSTSLGYASIFFNEKKYQAEYDRTLAGYGINHVSAGNYQVIKALAGFIIKTPEFSNTEVMLLFHLGYAVAVHPNLLVTNSELGVINSVDRNAGRGPVANMELKINYWMNERYGVSLKAGVNGMSSGFIDETAPERNFQMPLNHANINIGFVMNLKTASL
ncbi:MAG: hypothetical protein RBT50_10385 [Bacteroidales bacterium]|nr:hypothetical protein [Bacteroidales bacterium]